MTAGRWALIRSIWQTRQCLVCDQVGDCVHREVEVESALIDAANARDARAQNATSQTLTAELQPWLPGVGPATVVEGQRVH